MSKRHPNPRLVKVNRSYEVSETAMLLGVHKNTVRAWIKSGLPVVDNLRPTLILGSVLRGFLQEKRSENKRPCKPGELYCFKCRAPRRPAGNMADFQPVTTSLGSLVALCCECETVMYKRVSAAKLSLITQYIEVTLPKALKRIGDSDKPTVNSDFK